MAKEAKVPVYARVDPADKRALYTRAALEGVNVSDLIVPKIREAAQEARDFIASQADEGER